MLLSVMAVGVVSVSAAIVDSGSCGTNVTWTLDDNGVLTISGSGNMYEYNPWNNPSPWGTNVTSIVIEDGVTNIGKYAFCGRESLTSVTISDTVTSVGWGAFADCTSLTSVTIPDSVTSIGDEAFISCSNLTSISIPNTVRRIGHGAFDNCSSLISVTIPDSITEIEWQTFYGCRSLTNITIPESVTSIGRGAFNCCYGLTNIVIPDSVTSIGERAFENCPNLTIVRIGNSVTNIGEKAIGYENGNPTSTRIKAFPKNNIGINYLNTNNFRNSIVGDYYVNYAEELPENMIIESGNSGQTKVTLTTTPANLRVTVPTVLPVSVDSDNNVTVSDNAKIVNNSNGQVDVTNAVLSGNNSWTLAAFDTDFTKVPVDTKQYGFKLQGYSVPVSGNAYNNQFDTIAGNASLDLSYDANVAIQSDATTDAEIGNIVFTVAWHK